MPEREASSAGEVPADTAHPDAAESGGDPLEQAARAILGYLDDLAACRELCLRYQASAGFRPGPDALNLVAAAERAPECELRHVRAAAEALPSAGRWRGTRPGEDGTAEGEESAPVTRHVLWEGEPLHVHVVAGEFGLLRAELILPHRPEVPRMPLRATASMLRCLEYLLPAGLARPVPLAELADNDVAGLWDFLRRVTPESLPSGQCIWPGGAVQQPIPVDPFSPPA